MKYFTPELIARGQSDDPAVLDEVEATWEHLLGEYNDYVDSHKQHFTPGLRRIEDNYLLHDATVLGIGGGDLQFVLFLNLDTPPQSLLVFRYSLVEPPVINRESLPGIARRGGEPMWQYNELELVGTEPVTWRESLLLSNGWELTLHFRDIEVEEIPAILPTPRVSSWRPADEVPQPA